MYSTEALSSGVLDIVLYITLGIFVIGVLIKLVTWFSKNVGMNDKPASGGARFGSGIGGIFKAIFSGRLIGLIKVLIVDVVFQLRILKDKKDGLVWIMHVLMFLGFIGLFVFHALDNIDSDYGSTVSPWRLLRNVFGLMALVGLILAIVRRFSTMKDKIKTTGRDVYAIVIIAVILLTGFCLESIKLTSYSDYKRMEEEFLGEEDKNLEAYWVKDFSVVSPNAASLGDADMEAGKEMHDSACADCHTSPSAAFVSYGIAQITKPAALGLDKIKDVIWYIHILAVLLGMALLTFTKMFHVLSTPISLIVAEVTRGKGSDAEIATRQVVELDGCSHGGLCREECPVRVKRQERIDEMEPFGAVFEHVDKKSGSDLGNRTPAG